MPRSAISPSCMSGFDSFSEGLAFQLCNWNGFTAVEKIYFSDPNQPACPFLKLQLHHTMSKSCATNTGSEALGAFCRRDEEPILPENALRCLLPQPGRNIQRQAHLEGSRRTKKWVCSTLQEPGASGWGNRCHPVRRRAS